MLKCPKCNISYESGNFCRKCGSKLEKDTTTKGKREFKKLHILLLLLIPILITLIGLNLSRVIVEKNICAQSDLLATDGCPNKVKKEYFKGKEPVDYCGIHKLYLHGIIIPDKATVKATPDENSDTIGYIEKGNVVIINKINNWCKVIGGFDIHYNYDQERNTITATHIYPVSLDILDGYVHKGAVKEIARLSDNVKREIEDLLNNPQKLELLRNKTREAGTRGNLGALVSAIVIYYGDNKGVYPQTLDESPFERYGENFPPFIPAYISKIPKATLRSGIPHNESNKVTIVRTRANEDIRPSQITDEGGWIYSANSGDCRVNCNHKDSAGLEYYKYGHEEP